MCKNFLPVRSYKIYKIVIYTEYNFCEDILRKI